MGKFPLLRLSAHFPLDLSAALRAGRARRCVYLLGLAALAACHDARRDNPVDPDLTPAVAGLTAAASDSLGRVLLEWTPYRGRMPFAAYVVLRKEQGLEAVDTLAVIPSRGTTSFGDTSAVPDRDYEYRVEVRNEAGFVTTSTAVAVRSFSVFGVRLHSATPDDRDGTITITWDPYAGPGFEGYEIWRQASGADPRRVASLSRPETASWVDTSGFPGTVYAYAVRTRILGQERTSSSQPVSFELQPPAITGLRMSSACACAELTWSAYAGPRFVAYEVVRRARGVVDSIVARIPSVATTAFVDSTLEGNTEYLYRVTVVTQWEGIRAESLERGGLFHGLIDVIELRAESDTQLQAIDLAVDENGALYAVATVISATTARLMRRGLRFHLPGERAQTRFSEVIPHSRSPVRGAAGGGWVFAAVSDSSGMMTVVAVTPDAREGWVTSMGQGVPAGIYVDGELVVAVDRNGVEYRLQAADGRLVETRAALRMSLEGREGLPLQDLAFAPGSVESGGAALDQVFLLAPGRSRHKVLSRVWTGVVYGGGDGQTFDDGVGPGLGQSLNPLAIAWDGTRQRLLVVESFGFLQVLDATGPGQPRHYVTRWGRFGFGRGEFLATPTSAVSVVVDSEGRIHVADAATLGGRIQTFAP